MPTSQYLPFGTAVGANTQSYASYAAESIVGLGFQPGLARSEVMNTALRQASVAAAALASFAATYGPNNVLDDGSVTNFRNAIKAALDVLYTPSLGGYVTQSQFTGGNQDLSGPGYQRLPGGLILMWTDVYLGNPPSGFNAPIPFGFPLPVDEVLHCAATLRGTAYALAVFITDITTSGASIVSNEWSAYAQDATAQIFVIARKN